MNCKIFPQRSAPRSRLYQRRVSHLHVRSNCTYSTPTFWGFRMTPISRNSVLSAIAITALKMFDIPVCVQVQNHSFLPSLDPFQADSTDHRFAAIYMTSSFFVLSLVNKFLVTVSIFFCDSEGVDSVLARLTKMESRSFAALLWYPVTSVRPLYSSAPSPPCRKLPSSGSRNWRQERAAFPYDGKSV
jgi:hypothetical protein